MDCADKLDFMDDDCDIQGFPIEDEVVKDDIEKAIEGMKNIIEYWTYRPSEIETAKVAISALEKQIPKKPLIKPFHELMRQKTCYEVDCPSCGYNHLILEFENDKKRRFAEYGEYFKNCYNCGQKIDWEA